MTRAYIGLGSNVGDRVENLAEAIDRMASLDGVHVAGVSEAYEAEAWPNPADPAFANAVVAIETSLEPRELLEALQIVEGDMGRKPAEQYAPRIIDLDILLYGDEEFRSADLVIPHEDLLDRDFSVTPLVQLAPDVRMPDGTRVADSMPTAGRVLGSLGPIADVGAEHNAPILDMEWVVVAESESSTGIVSGPDFGIMYQASVLEEEGVPIGWEPFDPTAMSDPIGVDIPVRLLVPAEYAERASKLLDDVAKAVPVLDSEVEIALEAESDEAEF